MNKMTSLQDLITKREALITEVTDIEDRIEHIVKRGDEFDVDVYCHTHRGTNDDMLLL